MACSAVMSAVQARLAANWSYTPIIYPNDIASAPDDGSEILVLEFPHALETMMSTGAPGSNVYREDGGFLCTLCIRAGTTLNPVATPWADRIDALRAAFRGQTFSSVVCHEASPPFYDDQSDRGAYAEVSFVVTYKYDVFG